MTPRTLAIIATVSGGERWRVIGKAGDRILFISYCVRNGEIRIIHSRRANKKMRKKYEAQKRGKR